MGAILGMSTYTSALEVFYSKTEDGPEREPNEAMEIGRFFETPIIDYWLDQYPPSDQVDDSLVMIQSNTFPFLIHSPDALLYDKSGEYTAGVEVKMGRSETNWSDGQIPEFYYAQVQHGLLCSGLDRWIVIALVAGQKLIVREIEPDEEMMGRIALESERFWVDHVLKNIPPAPDGTESASRALRGHWGTSHDAVAEVTEADFERLKECSKMSKLWTSEYDKAVQIIQAKMEDKEVAKTPEGEKVATWKVGPRKTVDTKRLKDEAPELAKKYEKVSPTRAFRPNL